MTQLDWIMVCMYIVVAIIASVLLKTKGVAGVDYTMRKFEYILLGVGFIVSLYLIIRHPWYCLMWACVGSLITVSMSIRKLRRT